MESTIDDKWKEVESYYSRAYKIDFKQRPKDEKIQFLWEQMFKLGRSLAEEYERGRPELQRFIETKSALETQSSL